jgi:hypothetical protein
VTGFAAYGFATGSSEKILLAGALALPSSVAAGIAFYLAVGLLALVPGANPSGSSGSGSCSADGVCTSFSTGGAAAWWLTASDVLGVVALAAAAIANVWLAGEVWRDINRFIRARRAPSGSAAGDAS